MPYENIEEPSYLLMEEARQLYAEVMPPNPIDIDKAQRLMEGATLLKTSEFGRAIVENMEG